MHDLSAEFDRYRPRATDDATDLARLRELAATAEAGHAVDGPPGARRRPEVEARPLIEGCL